MDSLFRQEAMNAQQESQYGGVVLLQPLSFSLVAIAAVVIVLAAFALLVFGQYTQKVAAQGSLQPVGGITRLASDRQAIVTRMQVKEGDRVKAGQTLFTLSTEKESTDGTRVHASINAAYDSQIKSLDAELAAQRRLIDDETRSSQERLAQLKLAQRDLESEIKTQHEKIDIVSAVVAKYQELEKTQFVSALAVRQQEALLLDQRARLSELNRNQRQMQMEVQQLESTLAQLPTKLRTTEQPLRREIETYRTSLLRNDTEREQQIVATVDGTVSAVLRQPGQNVTAGQTVLTLVPADAPLQAELLVPSDGIGFVRPGNKVVLHYDAYPYQSYGLQHGRVLSVSRNTLRPDELQTDSKSPVYRVQVALDQQWVDAYGKRLTFNAGETLQAKILVRTKTVREWLLDPIYAMRGKL